eukprot:Hpha_TRINITY_DN3372_c0_g1::TRINITY_DN3372_c0_g1_i1::g.172494::m.172494/K15100/SLC25A1, CTP; solute carrier family 25 (mitochondrial citrate transporter), member 1
MPHSLLLPPGLGRGGEARRHTPASPVVTALVAGAATGGIETVVTYPTEYVKTHLQLAGRRMRMRDVVAETLRTHGPLGLYRGMSTLLAGAVPKQGVRWAAFELAAAPLRDGEGRLYGVIDRAAAGFVAGACEALLVVTPAETIKTAFIEDQRGPRRFAGLGDGVRQLYAQHGVRGLYRGALPTVLKQGTNQAVRFPAQFAALRCIADSAEQRRSPWRNGAAGVVAGCVSVLVTQPFDVVKTRMQQGSGARLRPALRSVAAGGVAALYAGTMPRMVRVGANVGLTFTVFPMVKNWLN